MTRPDRRPHPRHPCGAHVWHRSELDRRPHAERSAGEIRQAAKDQKAGLVDRRRRRAGPRSNSAKSAGRPPAEVTTAAPDNPVYIQHLYDWLRRDVARWTPLNIRDDQDVTPGGKLERDGDKPTGVISTPAATRSARSLTSCRSRPWSNSSTAQEGLPRDEQPRHHRHRRWRRRRKHVSLELSGRVQAVARQATHGARRLSSVFAQAGQRTGRPAEPERGPYCRRDSAIRCCISAVPARS